MVGYNYYQHVSGDAISSIYIPMITSSKADFRINLNVYSSINTNKPRTTRKTAPLAQQQQERTKQTHEQLSNSFNYSSIFDDITNQQLRRICKRTLTLYSRNLQFYHLNQYKLIKTIENQIRQKNYLYHQLIIKFIRTKQDIDIKQPISADKLIQQIELLNKFLEDLYEKKKIKEIQIIHSNLKQEQSNIVEKLSANTLDEIYDNLQLSQYYLCNDFIGQYQSICSKFGVPQPYLLSHVHIRNQISSSREDVINHFQAKKKSRVKNSHEHRRQL